MSMFDDPWDGKDWYYWDTERKAGRMAADFYWEQKQRKESQSNIMRLLRTLFRRRRDGDK